MKFNYSLYFAEKNKIRFICIRATKINGIKLGRSVSFGNEKKNVIKFIILSKK